MTWSLFPSDRPKSHEPESHGEQDPKTAQVESGMWGGTGGGSKEPLGHLSDEELNSLSFTELRDKVLGFDPLNAAHVNKVRALIVAFGWMSAALNINLLICIPLHVRSCWQYS